MIVGFYKRLSGKPSITWHESVDEALCFGWIDGVRRSIDHERRLAIFWVVRAKKEETRRRRLATLIEDSAHGRPIKGWLGATKS